MKRLTFAAAIVVLTVIGGAVALSATNGAPGKDAAAKQQDQRRSVDNGDGGRWPLTSQLPVRR